MHFDLLVAEIGSTTTTVSAFRGIYGQQPEFGGQGMAPTTVLQGDVTQGLMAALEHLRGQLGEDITYDSMFASSSAAGGLKMTVHGLVYDMTVKAAREAALGAGAVLRYVTSGIMDEDDLSRILEIRPNIILLAGGVDYGEKTTVIANARSLSQLDIDAPVIYAGNVAAGETVRSILESAGKKVVCVENVYPRIDDLNIEPTRRAIQKVFEEHIVVAPGMERIRAMVDGRIIPTPGAVMNAALLLYEQMGDLMVVDVGGATTDVHSVTSGSEEISELLTSPEPLAKRTVEGDLGIFVNAPNVVSLIGEDTLRAELGVDPAVLIKRRSVIPADETERRFVERLAEEAVTVAVSRHAGKMKYLYGPTGRVTVAEGKDLTKVRWIIGTGGALTRLPGAKRILEGIPSDRRGKELYPKDARVLVDSDYIMAAAGTLGLRFPDAATKLMLSSLGWGATGNEESPHRDLHRTHHAKCKGSGGPVLEV